MISSVYRLAMRTAVMAMAWSAALPATAGEYLFFGTSRPKMASLHDCPKWTYETKEFDTEAEAKAYLQAFLRDPTHGDHNVNLFSARSSVVVYRYPGTTPGNPECVVEKYGAVSAATRDGALARMQKEADSFKGYFAGAPQVAQTWGGLESTGASAADRLEERDIVAGKNGKVTVVAKVRNRSPDKTAFVTYVVDGNRLATLEIPPGDIVTMPLGKDVKRFERRVKFIKAEAKGKPLDQRLLDSIKESVRDSVIRKGSVQSTERPWSGVRG